VNTNLVAVLCACPNVQDNAVHKWYLRQWSLTMMRPLTNDDVTTPSHRDDLNSISRNVHSRAVVYLLHVVALFTLSANA